MIEIGQKRISDTFIGNTEASEVLGMNPANVAKALARGLNPATIQIEVLREGSSDGNVVAMKVPVGDHRKWLYRRERVERVRREREADVKRREADARRRETARAKAAS